MIVQDAGGTYYATHKLLSTLATAFRFSENEATPIGAVQAEVMTEQPPPATEETA